MIYLHCGLHVLEQTFSPIHFLVAAGVLAMFHNSKTFGFEQETESFLQGLPQYQVVHPYQVDAKGHFLSNFVSHRVSRVQRRETQGEPGSLARVFYQLQHGGRNLHFSLTLNPHLLAPGFLTERRYGGLEGAKIHSHGPSLCHFIGEVWDQATMKGRAAISTCDGLTGLFKLSQEEFFIRPLERSSDESTAPQVHIIYKRHTSPTQSQLVQPISGDQTTNSTCGVKDPAASLERVERQRERWERRQRRKRRIRQRSISREKWVETLVVADSKMVEYHGTKGVESYVLAVMNIVSGLFRDASIGNPINIVVVRLILLEKEEGDLKITHHADNSLSSFCKWQKRLNMKGEEHAVHHDVAVLLTRKDICAAINKPCETLGLSHVAGMCQPHRSCSISEDTGLPLAFTVAHELGHNDGEEVTLADNFNDIFHPLKYEADLLFTRDSNPSRCEIKADISLEVPGNIGPPFNFTFQIQNLGFFPVRDLQLNIEIPEMTKNGNQLLQISDFNIDQTDGTRCIPPQHVAQSRASPEDLSRVSRLNHSNTLPLPVQCTVNLNPYREVSVRIRGALRLDALHALRFKVLELVTSASVELPPSSPMFLHEERPVRHIILEIRKEGDYRISIWIIIGSTLGGLLLLSLLSLALWKLGFFQRQKRREEDEQETNGKEEAEER